MSLVKCHTPLDVKLHWAQCVKSTIRWNHFQSSRYRPLKLCLICRCGLPLMVAIWQENQHPKPCDNQVLKLRTNNWLPILVAMHKWFPNLVAKFWLPNLVLYQTVEGTHISLDKCKMGNVSNFGERERERLSLSAFWGTEDIGVHIVHISRVIITYTLE